MKVTVIIPAYNEAGAIAEVINNIKKLHPDFEIIVINDGSDDNTASIAKHAGAIVHSHPYNIGNGAAIKTGIRMASGEIMVFMDGDGQHDPCEIQKLLNFTSDYDMVVGERSTSSQAGWFRRFGNTICNWVASYVANFKIRDLTSGFRVIKSDLARNFLYLIPNTYSYPTTLTLCILRSGRSLKYVPINVMARKSGKSNIKVVQDGMKFLMIIIKICTFYSPFRIFFPTSFLIFITGLLYYCYTFIIWKRFTNMSALLFTTSVIVFMIGLVSEQICQMRFDRSEEE
ncbi:dolichol-phosphate hexosyltransferase [Candidatus Magnetomoraceae bacterium gMMP-15]